jgi:ketosteroid isomerase-like protein
MPAKRPEEICHLFQHAMAAGDLDAVLRVYDPEAVFVKQSRDVTKGREGLRQELAPLVAMRARFDFTIKQVIEAGDIALMHTEWMVWGPQSMQVYAIEVARRQPDGTWCWLIGDPYTVGREVGSLKQGGEGGNAHGGR